MKDIVLIILFTTNFKKGRNWEDSRSDWPKVSVLLAVRNEENTIQRCLDGLRQLNYKGDWEILVGNDQSEDSTLNILRKMEQEWPGLRVFDIERLVVKKRGKMNVLAQLAEEASGEYFFMTDADTKVPQNWLEAGVSQFDSNLGTVTGVTHLDTNGLFGRLQNIDWLHSISMLKVVHDTGVNVTAIGNNMVISKEAYESVGGYAEIPFSITEDFKIYHAICKKGYRSFHMFESTMLSQSLPQVNLVELVKQRKRWMSGAFQLPIPMLSLLILNAIYFPVLVVGLIIDWPVALTLALLKWIIQSIFIAISHRKLSLTWKMLDFIVFELYAWTVDIITFIIFITPVKTVWKGRNY